MYQLCGHCLLEGQQVSKPQNGAILQFHHKPAVQTSGGCLASLFFHFLQRLHISIAHQALHTRQLVLAAHGYSAGGGTRLNQEDFFIPSKYMSTVYLTKDPSLPDRRPVGYNYSFFNCEVLPSQLRMSSINVPGSGLS